MLGRIEHRSAACWMLVLTLSAATADAADPRISRLDPKGAQRGTEVDVHVVGQRLLDDPQGILLSQPGIDVVSIGVDEKKQVRAMLRIAEDCPLGPHFLRLRTASGHTNLVSFHVGALAERKETEPNNTPDKAEEIPLGCVVNGVIQREDRDYFSVEVPEGERFSIEVEGLRLGEAFYDPAVVVTGPDGKVVAEADDSLPTHHDPSLSFVAPQAGRYTIRLQEVALRGAGNNRYRLHVGTFSRPRAVYPPVAEQGKPTTFRWITDANVEVKDAAKHSLQPERDSQALLLPNGDAMQAPTSLPVRVAKRPVVTEVEPNDAREQATESPAPAAVAGVIEKSGDRDFFQVTMKKNQTLDFRGHARRLRSPLDMVLRMFDAKGKRLAGNDDDQGQPDSYFRFRAPADGTYLLEVTDNLGRGGDDFVYAVEAQRPEPTVELSLYEQRRYVSTTIDVPQGNRTAVVMNFRRRDLRSAMNATFDNLPEGVNYAAPTVAAEEYRMPVVFSAEESAPLAGSLATVTATRADDGPVRSLFRQQEWFIRGLNNRPVWSHFAERPAIAVTKRAPFKLTLAQPKAPLVQSGSSELRVTAERDEGFDDRIAIRLLHNPSGVSSNRSRSIAKGQTAATIPITANSRARLGEWDIVVVGDANVGGRLIVSTQIVKLKIAEPHFQMKLPKMTTHRGKSIEYRVGIEQKTAFEGPAKITLVGLPPGVKAAPVEVDAKATEVVFQLAIDAGARLGRHRSLTCRSVLTDKGEPVTHSRGGGELIIDPAPSEAKADKKQTARRQPADKEIAS